MSQHTDESTPKRRRLRIPGRSPRTRSVVLAAGVLAIGISPFAVAQTTGSLRSEVRNGTYNDETEIIANEAASTGQKGGYATRQSNLSNSGGGAIYGCRSTPETAANQPKAPCIRANNLSTGLAFEFNAQNGNVVGAFTAGAGGDAKKPFVTNATGVATGLNADELDGLDGKQITDLIAATAAAAAKDATDKANASGAAARDRWITVRENDAGDGATIVAQSGGFSLVNCYQANGNCYINAGSDVTKKSLVSEIVTENLTENPGDNALLTGETSSSACNLASVLCAPDGTEGNNNVFVVTPRNSDGSGPPVNDRYTFTVRISGADAA